MADRGERRRIATNVWEDDKGRNAIAKVGTHRKEKRFPKTTSLRVINAWLEDTRREFRKRRTAWRRRKGKLAGDIETYVATLPKGRAKSNTASYLAAWLRALGEVKRSSLTVDRLQGVVTEWIDAGVAASTIKHRRRALAQLHEALDGLELPNPARRVKAPREEELEPRGIDVHILNAIIDGMDTARTVRRPGAGGRGFRNKTKARLRMMLWTGIPPESLRKLSPHAIDLERRTLSLPARQKGRGAPAVTLPLFPQGVEACREWLRAFAWGRFDQRALGKSFHMAVHRYVAQEAAQGRAVALPADLHPYDLRHSFLSWLWTETEDILLVQHFAQHANLATTRRYTRGAVNARAKAVVDRVFAKQSDRAVGTRS